MKKIFSSTFVIILTIILSFSLYKIIIWIRENKQNDKIINEVSESISTVQDNNKIDNTINYNVNFDKLKLINPDCIAWLKVEGTSIKYPIVKGSDNSFYLKHSLDKAYNSAGWPFIDFDSAWFQALHF